MNTGGVIVGEAGLVGAAALDGWLELGLVFVLIGGGKRRPAAPDTPVEEVATGAAPTAAGG